MKPSIPYSEEIATAICTALVEGASLRGLLARPDMPCLSTVMRWLAEKPDFRRAYGIARVLQADRLADDILAIADGREEGAIAAGEEGAKPSGSEAIQRAKLRVDTRKWLMVRLAPKKYGDALLSGEIDDLETEAGPAGNRRGAVLVQLVRFTDENRVNEA